MHGVAFVLAGFSFVALLLAWNRWLARRRLAALGHVAMAIAALAGCLLLWPVAADLATYGRLAHDSAVAELHFEQTGSHRFRVTLVRLPAGRTQVFELLGDEWRIEARTLEWQQAATRLGLRSTYRLERLGARHAGSANEEARVAAGFALSKTEGADLWARSRSSAAWGRHLVGRHATSPWRPMADDARFVVRMGERSLQVAAANAAAARATAAP